MNDECGGQTVYMQPITTQLKGQHFNVATKKKKKKLYFLQ